MDLDIAQLRAFAAAAEQGHFGRAADSLHLTQQALSKRIARLEAGLGTLFTRGRSGVTLTRRGELLLPHAHEVLAASDAAVAAVREGSVLRIDVWGHIHPLMPLVRAFVDSHPEAQVEIGMRRSLPQALDALRRDELDVASGRLDAPLEPELDSALVAATEIVALVGRDDATEVFDRHALQAAETWWAAQGSSPELTRFVAAFADAFGLRLRDDAPNLGWEALIERLAARPGTVTFAGREWPLPPDAPVRAVPIRPAPLYLWHVVWRRHGAHPLVATLVDELRAAGRVPDVASSDHWVPCPG